MKSNNNSMSKDNASSLTVQQMVDKRKINQSISRLPKKPADEYERKVTSFLKKKYNEETIDEKHSAQHVKMAIGVAKDKRYAGGNMSGAIKAMNKINPGLSDHPRVQQVLKKANESLKLSFKDLKNNIIEKTLTPAEMKKREEIAKAMEKTKPDMPMGMKMAIATDAAKKVAEGKKSVTELSNELLGRYKKAASTSASAADAKGDMATGNKRFSGIVKATKKQFKNDMMRTEEMDDEGKMARGQLMRMASQATALIAIMDDYKQLDGWVQSKLTMASDYLDSAHDYLMHNEQDVDSA